jgi:hypothetical protein
MPEELCNELSELFAVFLPQDMASRFSKLLALEPDRWEKIDPWRVWQHIDSRSITEWQGSIQDLLTSSAVSGYSASLVTALRCGHDTPSIQRLTLTDALVGSSSVFEGFISIVPGKVGLAINHDGMICALSQEGSDQLLKQRRAERPRVV